MITPDDASAPGGSFAKMKGAEIRVTDSSPQARLAAPPPGLRLKRPWDATADRKTAPG